MKYFIKIGRFLLLFDRDRILAKAGFRDYAREVTRNFNPDNVKNSAEHVCRFFEYIRAADCFDALNDKSLKAVMSFWNEHVDKLFHITPSASLFVSMHAFEACAIGNAPCDRAILNAVCAKVNSCIRPALDEVLSGGMSQLPFVAGTSLECVEKVIKATAGYPKSQYLDDTFFEALTIWENILFSRLVPPASRYDRVVDLEVWGEKYLRADNRLLERLSVIREGTVFSSEGVPLLLNAAEELADEIVEEALRNKVGGAISINAAFAVRAGLPPVLAPLYQNIESAMAGEQYDAASDLLCDLFLSVSMMDEEEDDEYDEGQNHHHFEIDPVTLSYWGIAAGKLQEKAPKSAFRLAGNCVRAIEDYLILSEPVQAKVYGVALPVAAMMESSGEEYRAEVRTIYKTIMKRSAGFQNPDVGEEYFSCAAEAFTSCLISMTPADRYREVLELCDWIGASDLKMPLLNHFVEGMLLGVYDYGNEKVIFFPDDDNPVSGTAEIKSLSLPEPT